MTGARAALAALAAVAIAAASGAGSARADEDALLTGSLKAMHDSGNIRIGYRDTSVPFSFLNRAGQAIGFSLDLCHAIATSAANRLGLDLLEADAPTWQRGLRLVYMPVAADQRLAKLVAGEIDLECGSTTANAERERTVAFSPVFFLAGTKLLVAMASPISSARDLAGRRVVVGRGTTNAEVMRRLAAGMAPAMTVIEVPNLADAYVLLATGGADAFASDDILLAGLAATRPNGSRFRIVGDYLSYEPYAIAFRRDDPTFAELVASSFRQMATEGVLDRLYARWFMARLPTGERLNLPISSHLTEMYRALGQPD